MSAINTVFGAKAEACPLYGWVAQPCTWYVHQWSVVWNPTVAQNTISAVAIRVIKSVGLLLISPLFGVLGIALVGLGKIAESRLNLKKKEEPLEDSTALVSQSLLLSKADLVAEYAHFWQAVDSKADREPIRRSLQDKLKSFHPQEALKTDPDLLCIQETIDYLDTCDQRKSKGQGPAIGTRWFDLVAPINRDQRSLGMRPNGGADVLKVHADGDCLFHAFCAQMILLGREPFPKIGDQREKILKLRKEVADYLAVHLQKAQDKHQLLPGDAQYAAKPFREFKAIEHLYEGAENHIAQKRMQLHDTLESIDKVVIPNVTGKELAGAQTHRAEILRELEQLTRIVSFEQKAAAYIAKVRDLHFHGGYPELYALTRRYSIQIEVKRLERRGNSHWEFLEDYTFCLGEPGWPKITLIHTGDHYDAELLATGRPEQAACLD